MKFRLFGIPIRVSPFFLLIAALIGAWNVPPGVDDIVALVIAIPIIFVAVLAHELGHAFAGMAFRLEPRIELHGMGGLTSWKEGRRLTPWRSLLISLAGPLVGIAVGTPVLIASSAMAIEDPLVQHIVAIFVFVNLGWGILNLIPMMPLDGGNIMASFLELFAEGHGRIIARYISLAISALIIAVALVFFPDPIGKLWTAGLVAMLAWSNWKALQAERQIGPDMPLLDDVRDVQKLLEKGDGQRAAQEAERLLPSARTPLVRQELYNMLAWGRFASGDLDGARRALASSEQEGGQSDPALWGAVRLELGDVEGAVSHLERALGGRASRFVDEKLAEAYIRGRLFNRALAFYSSEPGEAATPAAIGHVRDAAHELGAAAEARRLDDLIRSKS